MNYKLIFVTTSPRRKQILKKMNIKSSFINPDYIEKAHVKNIPKPEKLSLMHAKNKVLSISSKYNNKPVILIGIDTIVSYKNSILGKPKNIRSAKKMIKTLNNKAHTVISSVFIKNCQSNKSVSGNEKTQVFFNKMENKTIDKYLRIINPLDKAGGYAIQEYGFALVKKINGDYDNVVGLPVRLIDKMLKKLNSFSLLDYVNR